METNFDYLLKKEEYAEIGRNSIPILILIAFANFCLVALAPEAVAIMAPKSYYDAIWVIPPVAAGTFFIFMYSLFSRFEFYFERTRFMMIASVAGACMNVLLNYIFIPIYGYYAAGYTTLVCYMLYCIGHYLLMRRINKTLMNNTRVYNVKVIVGISAVFLAGCAVMMSLYTHMFIRWGVLLVVCAYFVWKRERFISLLKMMKAEKKGKKA